MQSKASNKSWIAHFENWLKYICYYIQIFSSSLLSESFKTLQIPSLAWCNSDIFLHPPQQLKPQTISTLLSRASPSSSFDLIQNCLFCFAHFGELGDFFFYILHHPGRQLVSRHYGNFLVEYTHIYSFTSVRSVFIVFYLNERFTGLMLSPH